MASVGPDLPPHLLAKRKRQAEEGKEEEEDALKRAKSSPSSDAIEGKRIMGPAAPPADLRERPVRPADEDEDSSDDDFGPALPTGDDDDLTAADNDARPTAFTDRSTEPEEPALKRDDWMTLPPSADGLRNLDPSRLRPGKFRSGKGGSSGVMDSAWTETPEEKRKRLADQVMGAAPSPSSRQAGSEVKTKHDEESARRIKVYNERHRGKSLLEQHAGKEDAEQEDDPSKRAFDRQKDVGGSVLNASKRREVMNHAANLGSKFSGGKFL